RSAVALTGCFISALTHRTPAIAGFHPFPVTVYHRTRFVSLDRDERWINGSARGASPVEHLVLPSQHLGRITREHSDSNQHDWYGIRQYAAPTRFTRSATHELC